MPEEALVTERDGTDKSDTAEEDGSLPVNEGGEEVDNGRDVR